MSGWPDIVHPEPELAMGMEPVKPPSVTKFMTELPSVEVKRSFVPVASRLPLLRVMLFEVVT